MRFTAGPEVARLAFLVAAALPSFSFAACSGSNGTGSQTQPAAGSTGGGTAAGGAAAVATDGGFPSAPFQTFTTDAKDLRIELRTSPFQPPQIGEGRDQLSITDAATGDPVDGLIIKVEPYMPDMHHPGSALAPVVEPQGNGVYLVTRVAFAMAGKAELKITISGSRTGTVVSPTFDIPE